MKQLILASVKSASRALGWIALTVAAIFFAIILGSIVLNYVPLHWQSQVALWGSALTLVLAVAIGFFRSSRESGFFGALKLVAGRFGNAVLLLIGAYALLILLLLLILPA